MSREITIPARPTALPADVDATALIVVDMQNAYCSVGGYLDLQGFDVSGAPAVIAETRAVIDACKAAGILVIYLQMGYEPDHREVGGPGAPVWHKSNALRMMRENPAYAGKFITKGTWDYQIVDELAPTASDLVVPKSRYSGFAGTNLEQILNSRRIRTVLVAGVATNVCVESTLRDAYHREYFPVMLTDATMAAGGPEAQKATEFNVEKFFGWLSTGVELRRSLQENSAVQLVA